jgi:hypothetical protein
MLRWRRPAPRALLCYRLLDVLAAEFLLGGQAVVCAAEQSTVVRG